MEGAPTAVQRYTICLANLASLHVVKSSGSPWSLPLPGLRRAALGTRSRARGLLPPSGWACNGVRRVAWQSYALGARGAPRAQRHRKSTAVWLCTRCSNELAWERVRVPGPAPACMRCNVPMLWEVDMNQRSERWVCNRCTAAGPPRALTLHDTAQPTTTPTPVPAPPPAPPPAHAAATDLAQVPPPSLPFTQHTNSRFYVPLLLHAAGMVSPETRAAWTAEASIGAWWRCQVEAASARPFLPVHDTIAAIALVAQARGDDLSQSAPYQRLAAWAASRASGAESLSVMLRVLAVPAEGHKNTCSPCCWANTAMPATSTPSAGTPRPRVALTGEQGAQAADDCIDAVPRGLPTDDNDPAGASQGGAGRSALAGIPALAWSSLDAVDLAAEFGTPVPTMQSVPAFLRAGVRQAFVFALRPLREAYRRGAAPPQTRAWKLFLLSPRLLLHRAREPGTVGREALLQRTRDFLAGRWDALLGAARAAAGVPRTNRTAAVPDAAGEEAARARRRELACANVWRGEVSRARGAAIVPGTDDTFAALSDPARRPPGGPATRACGHPQLSARLAARAHRRRRRSSSADRQAWHRCWTVGCHV
ncbi:PPP1R12B [Symbiodinium sp. CCMP2592]|nr:PPP1R12B [Symbiodinium sp. CCMP2592]